MDKITHNNESYFINGKPVFFISGEFHYFRVEKSSWREKLILLKEAGVMCVATYIPWVLHEPEEGSFDFSSKPYLMLEAFLRLCKELELYVICRPGPYQYSEIRALGLPYWLIRDYPQIRAHTIDGKDVSMSSVSYMHPLFLEKSKAWFAAVCSIIARYTIRDGGSVLYVQVDNELMGVHDWRGTWDYNKEGMGIGRGDGRYARFLEARYGSIEEVNRSYHTAYKFYAEVRPICADHVKTHSDLRKVKDYQDFYFGVIGEYAATLKRWIRDNGIDSEIIHNSASPYMNAFFLKTVEAMGDGFILGTDHYYNLDMDWDQNNPTPKYAVKCYASMEMLRNMGMPASIYEMPAGSGSDWPPVTAQDLECAYMLHTAFGMKGVNYYILAGGANPEKIGATTDMYDYGAPISPAGEKRDSYRMMKQYHQFLKEHDWLAGTKLAADFNIAMDVHQSRCQFEKNKKLTMGVSNLDIWSFMRKGYMITALCHSYTPALVDIEGEALLREPGKPLLVPAASCMSKQAQLNVIEFVRKGGSVLLAPCIPVLDENYLPCTVLQDFLDCGNVAPYSETPWNLFRLNVGDVQNVRLTGSLYAMDRVPDGAERIAVEEEQDKHVGWIKQYGAGRVMWLGLQWKYQHREHGRMVEWILARLGVKERQVSCDNPNLWAVKRTDGQREMLFVMNLFTSPFSARVKVQDQPVGMFNLPGMTVQAVEMK